MKKDFSGNMVRQDASSSRLPYHFGSLCEEAESLWTGHQNAPAFEGYVSADYRAVYPYLEKLQGRVANILEWGSGLGVVSIMASKMGFDAYGIEVEEELVWFARELCVKHGANAQFASGSFIPSEFPWNLGEGDEANRTVIDVAPAYDKLDMELRDFDVVYAYPWPDEHTLFRSIMRKCGSKNALLLTYDVREGVQLIRCGR